MKINVLYLGKISCKRDNLVRCEDENVMIESPISAILIRHPKIGNILYDTGNSPCYAQNYPLAVQETYPISEFISIEDALQQQELTVNDIDMLILSHLHFDHAGGLCYFRKTKAIQNVMVAEDELKDAYFNVMTGKKGAYVKELFDIEGINYIPYQNKLHLAEDIQLFAQKSHTAGCTGIILKTHQGTIIVTSDTVYTEDNYKMELPPGGSINATTEEFYTNLAKIKKMQSELDAKLIYGHDFKQITRLCKYTLE
ncbi:MAG: N-acyl homoserine lactonase family protein [Lachnospiraceae bacterium]